MKKLILILSCLNLCLAPVVFTGCSIVPDAPKARVFLTLKDTWAVKDRAMRVYADKAVRGKLTVEQRREVWAIHAKFQAAFDTALALVDNNWSALTPDDVERIAAELVHLIDKL